MSEGLIYERIQGDYLIKCTKGIFQPKVTEFVANVYYNRRDFNFDLDYNSILREMLDEDYKLKDDSTIYTIYNNYGNIIATIRKIEAKKDSLLPIEREFNVDISSIVDEHGPVEKVYEIARMATMVKDPDVFKTLLREGIYGCSKDDLFVASLDSRVLRGLKRLGFPWFDLNEPKHYLGSLTCPVAVNVRDVNSKFIYDDLKLNV
ncbi:MAG: hypothetical protein Q8936_04415 [Bacillota bacterium]|nr:hypothetical protein [Bacillota bacterium]